MPEVQSDPIQVKIYASNKEILDNVIFERLKEIGDKNSNSCDQILQLSQATLNYVECLKVLDRCEIIED